MTRRQLLHSLYASIGRGNDAVAAGDRRAHEREVARQVDLRGLIAGAPPPADPGPAARGAERHGEVRGQEVDRALRFASGALRPFRLTVGLWREGTEPDGRPGDRWWVAQAREVEVCAQGRTPGAAVASLASCLQAHLELGDLGDLPDPPDWVVRAIDARADSVRGLPRAG